MSCWDRICYWWSKDSVQMLAVFLFAITVVVVPISWDYYTAEPITTNHLETMVEYVEAHPEFKPQLAQLLNNDGEIDENEEIYFWDITDSSERKEYFKKIVTP